MEYARALRSNLEASILAKQSLLADQAQMTVFSAVVNEVVSRYRNGGRLYIAGNGGSAADAQHLACEFVVRLARDRASLPAEVARQAKFSQVFRPLLRSGLLGRSISNRKFHLLQRLAPAWQEF